MSYKGLRVIDFHAHFPTLSPHEPRVKRKQEMLQEYGEETLRIHQEWALAYREERLAAWDMTGPEEVERTDEEQAERWASEVDEHGIDKVIFVTGGGNDNLARIVNFYPEKFIGFAHHDPFDEGAAEELERAVTVLGLKGYKCFGTSARKPMNDKSAYPVWETAQKLGIPVLIHFGSLGGGGGINWNSNIDPLVLEPVAKAFPRLNFVIPHFGAGWWRELLMLCWSCKNVSIDTSGSNDWMRWMPYELNMNLLYQKALETVGPDRLIFATDSTWMPRGFILRYLQEEIKVVRQLHLHPDDVDKIFYRNAARLLNLEE